MKGIAIDDEPIALDILREYSSRIEDLELKTYPSPTRGIQAVLEEKPDVVFLDIEMKSHNGIELARRLPPSACVVFTTAFAEYALEGFEVDAVDFLHKPIFFPRFLKAVERVRRRIEGNGAKGAAEEGLTLKVEYKNVVVKYADILYAEAMDNYVKVFRRNLPTIVSQITMKELEERLPADKFMRIHRSYIVAVSEIEKFTNRQIFLSSPGLTLPVGRKYVDACKELNKSYTIKTNEQR